MKTLLVTCLSLIALTSAALAYDTKADVYCNPRPQATCTASVGCEWNRDRDRCQGNRLTYCLAFPTSGECRDARGCEWDRNESKCKAAR